MCDDKHHGQSTCTIPDKICIRHLDRQVIKLLLFIIIGSVNQICINLENSSQSDDFCVRRLYFSVYTVDLLS